MYIYINSVECKFIGRDKRRRVYLCVGEEREKKKVKRSKKKKKRERIEFFSFLNLI